MKYDGKLLNNDNKQLFNIKKFKWIQFKIEINNSCIKLKIFRGYNEYLYNKISTEENNNIFEERKSQTKIYSLKEILQFDNDKNLIIESLNFFKNYFGLIGTIIFYNKNNLSETPIN